MFGSEKLSQAAPQPHRAADVTTDKIPAAFDPATGLAAQPATSGKTWTDSIYVNSEVKAGGHDFGIHVITLRQPDVDQYSLSVVVTDETSGWYKRYGVPIAQHDYHWSTSGLDIKMPGLTWKGNAQRMSLKATTPWGGLDIKLVPKGPALELTVRVNGPEDQEAADKAGNGVYEAPAVYTGVYEGKKVTGKNYTEHVGDWRR
ncbi:hypothetical protein [Streptomyces mirabilis]|uniref:hypothetical protein n=1 Tax=Streptomyces mirabilis TaxID=68239 RepID=UPI0036AD97FB